MTTRILPPAEYPRLVGTELETVWPVLPPSARVIVVEDEHGAIVGCWSLFLSVHAEGVWIAPGSRARGTVARRLLEGLAEQLEDIGADAFMTGAVDDGVRRLIQKLHGTPVPGEQFVIQRERLTCQPR